jgi:hypothetical protein
MKIVFFGLIASLAFFNLISCSDNIDIEENSSNKILIEEYIYNFVKTYRNK